MQLAKLKPAEEVTHEAEVPAAPAADREALAKASELRRVASQERTRGSFTSMRKDLQRRASSLMQMGGIKPSLLKQRREGGGTANEPQSGEDADETFITFVNEAHAQLQHVLLKQKEEMARIDARIEAERIAAEKKERALLLERHLKQKREVQSARDEAEAERLRATQVAEREALEAKERHRDEQHLCDVFDEILETEATYLADLKAVHRHFLVPLRSWLSPAQHQTIFSNLEVLLTLHEKLGEDLHPAAAIASRNYEERGLAIAAAFLKMAPFFKTYAQYSAQYAHVPEALEDARKDAAVDAFLKRVAAGEDTDPSGSPTDGAPSDLNEVKAGLQQLLFRPVQRMCLYPLLMKQALAGRIKLERWEGQRQQGGEEPLPRQRSQKPSQAPAAVPLRAKLEEVFNVIGQTLGTVNEEVRGLEAQSKTIQVLERCKCLDLVAPNRVLQYEAQVDMRSIRQATNCCELFSARAATVRRSYRWYVFSDGILICHNRERSWPFLGAHEIKVEDWGNGSKGEEPDGAFLTTITVAGVETLCCWAKASDAAVTPDSTKLLKAVREMQAAVTKSVRQRLAIDAAEAERRTDDEPTHEVSAASDSNHA